LNGKKQELSNSKSIYCNSDGCFILHPDERKLLRVKVFNLLLLQRRATSGDMNSLFMFSSHSFRKMPLLKHEINLAS